MGHEECTHISHCELFPVLTRGGFLRVWQTRYCQGEYRACARFQASARRERPPNTLLPSGEQLSLEPT